MIILIIAAIVLSTAAWLLHVRDLAKRHKAEDDARLQRRDDAMTKARAIYEAAKGGK